MEIDLADPMPDEFPQDGVIAAIDAWWAQEQLDAQLPGDAAPAPDIMKPATEIDSHRAVRALLSIEEVVKIEIPESVIKDGGYDSIDEMKDHIVPKIRAVFEKERKKQHA